MVFGAASSVHIMCSIKVAIFRFIRVWDMESDDVVEKRARKNKYFIVELSLRFSVN